MTYDAYAEFYENNPLKIFVPLRNVEHYILLAAALIGLLLMAISFGRRNNGALRFTGFIIYALSPVGRALFMLTRLPGNLPTMITALIALAFVAVTFVLYLTRLSSANPGKKSGIVLFAVAVVLAAVYCLLNQSTGGTLWRFYNPAIYYVERFITFLTMAFMPFGALCTKGSPKPANESSADVGAELRILNERHNAGQIGDEEYERRRAELIKKL